MTTKYQQQLQSKHTFSDTRSEADVEMSTANRMDVSTQIQAPELKFLKSKAKRASKENRVGGEQQDTAGGHIPLQPSGKNVAGFLKSYTMGERREQMIDTTGSSKQAKYLQYHKGGVHTVTEHNQTEDSANVHATSQKSEKSEQRRKQPQDDGAPTYSEMAKSRLDYAKSAKNALNQRKRDTDDVDGGQSKVISHFSMDGGHVGSNHVTGSHDQTSTQPDQEGPNPFGKYLKSAYKKQGKDSDRSRKDIHVQGNDSKESRSKKDPHRTMTKDSRTSTNDHSTVDRNLDRHYTNQTSDTRTSGSDYARLAVNYRTDDRGVNSDGVPYENAINSGVKDGMDGPNVGRTVLGLDGSSKHPLSITSETPRSVPPLTQKAVGSSDGQLDQEKAMDYQTSDDPAERGDERRTYEQDTKVSTIRFLL